MEDKPTGTQATIPKVGDYVRALWVTSVPLAEVDVDMTREGIVIEIRDRGTHLLLQSWQDIEFTVYAAGAVVVDETTLDEFIRDFIFMARFRLGLTQ